MLTLNDLKVGVFIKYNGEPCEVIYSDHIKMAQSKGILRTKIKNLITGAIVDKTFKGGSDKFEEADLIQAKANFLYKEGENYFFMDNTTYDQFSLSKNQIGDKVNYIKEGSDVQILSFEGRPINLVIPIKMVLEVTQTSEGVRGDTAQGSVMKEATLETGHNVKVPLFIKNGENILVNTETGKYVERVNK
ncbi:MAG: elongation factor P [Patescibacteria group bacterium]